MEGTWIANHWATPHHAFKFVMFFFLYLFFTVTCYLRSSPLNPKLFLDQHPIHSIKNVKKRPLEIPLYFKVSYFIHPRKLASSPMRYGEHKTRRWLCPRKTMQNRAWNSSLLKFYIPNQATTLDPPSPPPRKSLSSCSPNWQQSNSIF